MKLVRVLKFIFLFVIGFLSYFVEAQSTNVALTVTSPPGQNWINGTVSYKFKPAPNFSGNSQWQGADLPGNYLVTTTSNLNSSGVGAFTVPSSTAITPAGSSWTITVCPQATVQCVTNDIPVSGANQDISATVNASLNAISVAGLTMPIAYTDAEVTTVVRAGSIYYNSTSGNPRFYNGSIWQNFGTGGGGALPSVAGTVQYANISANAFVSGGTIDSDVFTTAANAQLLACSTTVCSVMRPPTTTDTTPANVLFNSGVGKTTSIFFDYSKNAFGIYAVNPGLANTPVNLINGTQVVEPYGILFTEPAPGTFQGANQGYHGGGVFFNSPGFSNGQLGCPLFCPMSPYSTIQDWALYENDVVSMFFAGAGIRETHSNDTRFLGIGDAQGGIGSNFITYAGGAVAPSDEGLHGIGSNHIYTPGDSGGFLTTIVDANHIVVNMTVNQGNQGQGRFALDGTTQPQDTSTHQPLTLVIADKVTVPGQEFPYGTLVSNSANFPISYAAGTLTNDCTVPAQFGGVVNGQNSLVDGCQVTVTSGTFDTVSPVCMASSHANLFDLGIKLSAVTALSGGHQTLTGTMHRSVQAGGYVFQGGMCSTAISLTGDNRSDVSQNGTTVLGSVFPIIGSTDAHTLVYLNYQTSNVWQPIPNNGSQWGTRDTANSHASEGFTASLVRTGGTVTATLTSRFQGSPNPQQKFNNVKFFNVSGCADSTFNTPGLNTFANMPGPGSNIVVYAQAGADSTCPAAVMSLQNTTFSAFWAAEIYDVENHSNGLVDGTMAVSWQPNYVVSDVIDVPTHYQSVSDILALRSEVGQPTSFSAGVNLTLNNYAVTSNAMNITFVVPQNFLIGFGGAAIPGNALQVSGQYGQGLAFDRAPISGSALLAVGPSQPFGGNSQFSNWNLWALDSFNASSFSTAMNFDEVSQTYTLTFNGAVPNIKFNALATQFFSPTKAFDAQFLLTSPASFINTHITQCSPIPPDLSNNIPMCYASVIPTTAVITQGGTAGTTHYQYALQVNDVVGSSFSKLYDTFTGNATLSGTNFNKIPCTDLPAGKTGEIYIFINPGMETVGACPNSSTVVNDTGVYGPFMGHNPLIAGTYLFSGGFAAVGTTGSFSFTQPDIFGNVSPSSTITAGISQLSSGNLSIDSTAVGNSAGNLTLHNIIINGSCTVGGVSCGTSTGGTVTTVSVGNLSPLFTASVANPTTTPAVTYSLNSLANFISVANISIAMPTGSIAANTCTTPVATTMIGVTTGNTFTAAFATNPTGVTGWGSTGGLVFAPWPTLNTINWSVCNQTASPITAGAISLNVGAR